MGRGDKTFKENPAGISSVLFYHATIIVHGPFWFSKNFQLLKNWLQTYFAPTTKTQISQTLLRIST
jgi:hypothetical protein